MIFRGLATAATPRINFDTALGHSIRARQVVNNQTIFHVPYLGSDTGMVGMVQVRLAVIAHKPKMFTHGDELAFVLAGITCKTCDVPGRDRSGCRHAGPVLAQTNRTELFLSHASAWAVLGGGLRPAD